MAKHTATKRLACKLGWHPSRSVTKDRYSSINRFGTWVITWSCKDCGKRWFHRVDGKRRDR